MNIFKILSSYDGTINEPNISAVLAYFFNPYEDHGISYLIINKIIRLFLENKPNESLDYFLKNYINYQVKVIPEFPVDITHLKSKRHRRDIDILIEFYKSYDDSVPDFSICVENKILESSFSDLDQLNEELLGLSKIYENSNNKKTELYFLLICPTENEKVKKSFEKMDTEHKLCLTWKNNNPSIINIFNDILSVESSGEIDPLSTELRYIIKSFIAFVNNDFQSRVVLDEPSTEKKNYGKPIVEYLKEIYDELDPDKEYSVIEIKSKLSDNVKIKSGFTLHNTTRNCQLYKATVNDPNRTNYYVNQPLDDRINLFYYTDINKRDKIKKFHLNIKEDIDIFWTEGGNRVSKKLNELLKQKNGA